MRKPIENNLALWTGIRVQWYIRALAKFLLDNDPHPITRPTIEKDGNIDYYKFLRPCLVSGIGIPLEKWIFISGNEGGMK
jgi:hypothetical protein